MPPRLRANDYVKGKISQDEIIAIQIANDANIAKARKAVKMGDIQQPTPMQTASPEELIADIANQESTARNNLERLGFRPQEAAQIIASIRIDPTLDFVSLNANFPAIEADVKRRFNVKLLTPTFFLDYFRKYSQELEGTTGLKVFDSGVNGLINTVGELKTILPSKEQFRNLLVRVQQIRGITKQSALLDPILERIAELEKALPSEVEYGKIEQLGTVERERIIDEINSVTEDLPSRNEIENVVRQVDRGNASGLADLANSIPNGVDIKLNKILERLRGIEQQQRTLLSKGRLSGDDQKNYLKSLIEQGDILIDDDGNVINKKSFINMKKDDVIRIFERWLDSKPTATEITADLKKGKGISKAPSQRLKTVKVGKGLSVKETPSYREYGKYAIHIPQLEQQDILNVKYKSLGQIPKFKPIPVSDVFRDFILDLLENGKPNARVYTQIAPEERKFFEEMSIGAGVWNGLGLKRTTTSTDEEENKRFEILRGEYMAGNNNPKLISELRRLVVKMMNDGRIRKNQGVQLLMELSI